MMPASTGANLKKAPGRRGDIMNRKRIICLCVVHVIVATFLFVWSIHVESRFGIYMNALQVVMESVVIIPYYTYYWEPGPKKAPERRDKMLHEKRKAHFCLFHMVLASTLFFWSLYFRYTFGIYFHLLEMAIAIHVVEDYYYPYYEPGSKEALRKGWK